MSRHRHTSAMLVAAAELIAYTVFWVSLRMFARGSPSNSKILANPDSDVSRNKKWNR